MSRKHTAKEFNKSFTFNVGIGYQYPLSKRTFVYAGAGYTKVSNDLTVGRAKVSVDDKTIEVVSGLVHTF